MKKSIVLSLVNLIPLQWIENPIMQIILGIAIVLNIILNLVLAFVKWYTEAKKDGKITSEEIEKLDEKLKKIKDEVIK